MSSLCEGNVQRSTKRKLEQMEEHTGLLDSKTKEESCINCP